MKKLVYLLSLVLVATVFFSCEKEGLENEMKQEQTIDITGDWDFVSTEFEGETYRGCDSDFRYDYDLTLFFLENVTETTLTYYTGCTDNGEDWFATCNYEIKDKVLIDDAGYKYQIVNYDTYNGSELKLKLIDQSFMTTLPVGAVYTLERY